MLQIAIHFLEKGRYTTNQTQPNSRRKIVMSGYQLQPANYRILKLLAEVEDLPRSRIVEYRYIKEEPTPTKQGSYFLLPITEEQLPQIEAITKTEQGLRVYLWRAGQWWSFPQLEYYRDGEMMSYTITTTEYGSLLNPNLNPERRVETRQMEKTKVRVRPTYESSKGPGFTLASPTTTPTDQNPANFPLVISGNGMVLEWKKGYEDKAPIWWLRDEQKVSKEHSATYRHYNTLKNTPQARWSRYFGAWYFMGGSHPPQAWLDLVGYSAEKSEEKPADAPAPTEAEQRRQSFLERHKTLMAELEQKRQLAEAMKPYHQFQAMLNFRQRYTERLHHLTATLALPAMATPSLDDPWS